MLKPYGYLENKLQQKMHLYCQQDPTKHVYIILKMYMECQHCQDESPSSVMYKLLYSSYIIIAGGKKKYQSTEVCFGIITH